MKVVFLGTGGTIPTEGRKHPALAIKREGDIFLFDCGEGVQTQIFKAHIGIARIRAILISHLHGDHVLGIPGLLMTMTQTNRSQPLLLIGPMGLDRWLRHIHEDLNFTPSFQLTVKEVEPGPVLVTTQFQIHAFYLKHSVLTLGYCFEEAEKPGRFQVEKALKREVPRGPLWGSLQSGEIVRLEGGRQVYPHQVLGPPRAGLKIVYAVDSRPYAKTIHAALKADLLIHDAMFLSEDLDKAQARGHSTAVEAAQVASAAGVGCLVLTHVSPRYRRREKDFLKEACEVFSETTVAEDLLEMDIRHPSTRNS
jgi:ribonuclease Z